MNAHPFFRNFCIAILAGFFLVPQTMRAQSASDWQRLFNGKNLDGWTQRGGDAEYYVKDSVIVGKAVLNSPNSFLCTREEFANFILKFEVKVDEGLNSGVQFRSLSNPGYRDGRVHGYQVEIDPEDPLQSGGIYDEARRGWLYNRAEMKNNRWINFKPGSWNSYRVEALGDTIRTWVNGVPAAFLVDSMTAKGFIGLQVHSIGDDKSKKGLKVRWRNLRIMTGQKARAHSRSMPIEPKITN